MSLNNSKEDRTNWTLDDYRKNAPDELERNPELYQRLVDKEFNNPVASNNSQAKKEDRTNWTLNDYRKNAPDELERNPELYQRLVDKEFNKR